MEVMHVILIQKYLDPKEKMSSSKQNRTESYGEVPGERTRTGNSQTVVLYAETHFKLIDIIIIIIIILKIN